MNVIGTSLYIQCLVQDVLICECTLPRYVMSLYYGRFCMATRDGYWIPDSRGTLWLWSASVHSSTSYWSTGSCLILFWQFLVFWTGMGIPILHACMVGRSLPEGGGMAASRCEPRNPVSTQISSYQYIPVHTCMYYYITVHTSTYQYKAVHTCMY